MLQRAILLTVLLAAAGSPASAQSSDPDAAPVRLGPFAITPALVVRDIGRDENVFNERDNPRSDFTMTIVPRAEVVVRPRGLRLTYNAATEYVYYKKYASERSTNLSSGVRADFLFSRFQPFVQASGTNSSARLNSEVDARAGHKERSYGAGVAAKVGTRMSLGTSWRTTQLRFDEGTTFRGEDLAAAFDSTIDVVDGSVGLQLTTFTQFSLSVSREMQRFDLAPERDADSLRITPSFSFSPDAVLNGAVTFGYRRFEPRSARLPGYSGLVATVNLGTTLFTRNRVELVVGRDLRYSYERSTPYYLATGATVTVTTELVGPFDVRGTGQRQVLAYRADRDSTLQTEPGDDTLSSYGGGFGYRVKDNVRLGINAEWSRRSSELSGDRNFRNRRIFASLTWGAP